MQRMLNSRLGRNIQVTMFSRPSTLSQRLFYSSLRIRGSNAYRSSTPKVPFVCNSSLRVLRNYSSKSQKDESQEVTNSTKTTPLHRDKVWTVPNILTMGRLIAAPVIGYLIVHDQQAYAVGVTVAACVTDFLDGFIARRFKAQSALGSILDPAADKALMITLASCLTISGAVPLWCGATILGRDVLLLFSAIFVRYASLPPPKTFWRYWDLSIPSVKVTPTTISKWNTLFQMVYLGVSLASPVLPVGPPELLDAMAVLVTATTVLSGASYITNRSAVKFIK